MSVCLFVCFFSLRTRLYERTPLDAHTNVLKIGDKTEALDGVLMVTKHSYCRLSLLSHCGADLNVRIKCWRTVPQTALSADRGDKNSYLPRAWKSLIITATVLLLLLLTLLLLSWLQPPLLHYYCCCCCHPHCYSITVAVIITQTVLLFCCYHQHF